MAPDQIGFCASTKPERYQCSCQQLAANAGALMYPDSVSRLVLVNPAPCSKSWRAEHA